MGLELAPILQLFSKLDADTTLLLMRYVSAALKSGDPSAYVKASMQQALDGSVVVIEQKR